MEKKNFPMNFLDPNKPFTISVEACESDEDELPNDNIPIEIFDSEDELPNANIPEKYVEAPGLPDLNFVLPIQDNIFNRQDTDNQEKNNLNNTVSSSSPVKSIQNTKESVNIVEHNSDNTSDDKLESEMESLDKVSNNLLNIIEMDGRMAEKNNLSNREIDRIKKLFLSMKYHHFSLSYDIVISLFLPRLADKNFITNFFDHTVNNARVDRTFDCSHKTIKTLFWEMIKWTKYKKGQIDFHENIKRMEEKKKGNEGTKKMKAKIANFVSNTTSDIENPQLCPNSDQIENNESDLSNTNVISKESNCLLTTTDIENPQLCPNSDQIENNESDVSNTNVISKESNCLLTTTDIENPQLCPNSDQIENNESDVSNTNVISKESNCLLTTTDIENPQLCPNSDQIENNESDVSNANVISKESNCLLKINSNTNFNSKVIVKANDDKLLKSLLNGGQVVINRNTIYENSNTSESRNEILPEERCISSALPAEQEVNINVQTKNNVNQETVSPQMCLQNCCQNATSLYSSDNETVRQSNSNMYTSHLENANYDKEEPNNPNLITSNLGYGNIFINQSKTPLHKNTSNHSNNQYQPSFPINTVVNPDNQYPLELHDNIAKNPSYHPQASLHGNTSNNSNIQHEPSLHENTINPDIHYQLALPDNIARNSSYHPQASLHRNYFNNSNIQYQSSLLQNTVVNPDNPDNHLTLHDYNGINQNNRPQASLHVNNYYNSNNQYSPSLHRSTGVNPNTNHNVPIIRGPTFSMEPNSLQSPRCVRNPNPAPIYRPSGINATNPNPPPIYRPNAINPNPPPIYRPNAINPNPPPIYRPNAINPNPPPIYRPNAINPNPPPIYRPNAINPNPPPIYRPNAINPNPPPIYRPNAINPNPPPKIYRPIAINPNPPPIYRPNAINPNPPPIYRPNLYQPINQRHNGVNPVIQHQPSLHTSSEKVPNIQKPPELQRKRKNYQPRKTVQKKNGQMNISDTSSSTTSSAESSEHPNASSPANTQNEENTSHQPQEAMEQCAPIITHETSSIKKCNVCGTLSSDRYCSRRCFERHENLIRKF